MIKAPFFLCLLSHDAAALLGKERAAVARHVGEATVAAVNLAFAAPGGRAGAGVVAGVVEHGDVAGGVGGLGLGDGGGGGRGGEGEGEGGDELHFEEKVVVLYLEKRCKIFVRVQFVVRVVGWIG